MIYSLSPFRKWLSFSVLSLTLIGGGRGAEIYAQAVPNDTATGLYFLANKDHVQLLNQKLEYRIPNSKSIQIGNLLISTDSFKLSQINQRSVTVEGPRQFMVGTSLLLKDPHGRALWTKTIDHPNQLMGDSKTKNNSNKNSAHYQIERFDHLIDVLTQSSFFNLCLFMETQTNRIQACTPNYAIEMKGDQWTLHLIESSEAENLIIVNGTEVNEHGIIQFDQNIKTVSLAAKLSSGLSLEVKTDYIELDLLDIVFDEPKNNIKLKMREQTKGRKKVYPWDTEVSLAAPHFYIEAFGQVPLRQELSISQNLLPRASDRPQLLTSRSKTYQDSVSLLIQSEASVQLKSATKGDTLAKKGKVSTWTLNNLDRGVNKPHLLAIQSKQRDFMGAFEVERGSPWDLSFQVGAQALNITSSNSNASSASGLSDSGLALDVTLHRYFDTFWGLDSPAHSLRWGLHLSASHQSYSSLNATRSGLELEASYRLTPGFHHDDNSTSLRVGLLNDSFDFDAVTFENLWMGFRLVHDGAMSLWPQLLGTHYEAHLAYYPFRFNADGTGTQRLSLSWQSRYAFGSRFFGSWKLSGEQTEFQREDSSLTLQTQSYGLQIGLGLQF